MNNDLISRQAAIDAVIPAMIDGADADMVEGLIHLLPSAQPEIVRCKECKYKQQCQKTVQHTTHEPTSVTIAYKAVDFCSYGERSE